MLSLISLSILQYSKTRLISFFWPSLSKILKLPLRPTWWACFLKNFAKIEWKVPIQGDSIFWSKAFFTLSLISLAALLVKVTAIILLKSNFRFFTIYTNLEVRTLVFPVPAPDRTKRGPFLCSTAIFCSLFNKIAYKFY